MTSRYTDGQLFLYASARVCVSTVRAQKAECSPREGGFSVHRQGREKRIAGVKSPLCAHRHTISHTHTHIHTLSHKLRDGSGRAYATRLLETVPASTANYSPLTRLLLLSTDRPINVFTENTHTHTSTESTEQPIDIARPSTVEVSSTMFKRD